MLRGSPEEKLTWTFNVYDVNNDGAIALEEMKEIMRVSWRSGHRFVKLIFYIYRGSNLQAIYVINEVSEAEQQKFGEKAFQKLDADGDGKWMVVKWHKRVVLSG